MTSKPSGAGMLIPRATKNSVMKKSFTVLTLVMISVLDGRLARPAPAISAAMPGPTDMCRSKPNSTRVVVSRFCPTNTRMKHQARAPIRISSGFLEIQ